MERRSLLVAGWRDTGGLDRFEDSDGSTLTFPEILKPLPAQVGQETIANAASPCAGAKIVNHRASLGKAVNEQIEQCPHARPRQYSE